MKKTLAILAVAGLASVASAQTFPGVGGGAIPDNTGAGGGGVTITFAVSGTNIGDALEHVSIAFSPAHTWVGDIVALLTAPNGDNVHVMSRAGTSGAGDSSDAAGPYRFFDVGASFTTAAVAAAATAPVPAGDYARFTTFAGGSPAIDADGYGVFTGDNLNGTWTLHVSDWAGADTGGVGATSITIVPAPGALALLGLGGLAAARRRRA